MKEIQNSKLKINSKTRYKFKTIIYVFDSIETIKNIDKKNNIK